MPGVNRWSSGRCIARDSCFPSTEEPDRVFRREHPRVAREVGRARERGDEVSLEALTDDPEEREDPHTRIGRIMTPRIR